MYGLKRSDWIRDVSSEVIRLEKRFQEMGAVYMEFFHVEGSAHLEYVKSRGEDPLTWIRLKVAPMATATINYRDRTVWELEDATADALLKWLVEGQK